MLPSLLDMHCFDRPHISRVTTHYSREFRWCCTARQSISFNIGLLSNSVPGGRRLQTQLIMVQKF